MDECPDYHGALGVLLSKCSTNGIKFSFQDIALISTLTHLTPLG